MMTVLLRSTANLSHVLVALVAAAMVARAVHAQRLGPRDVDALPSRAADARIAYGAAPLQFAELRLPAGNGPFPLAIVIHGGCWVSALADLRNTAALADALRDAGVATWNVEYRRLDDEGGGWPGTFEDIGAAVDHVRLLAKNHPIDAARVVVMGHSAGGHLALWAAARSRLPASSPLRVASPLPLLAAIAFGGPGDLRDFETYGREICGPAVERLLGGPPDAVPEPWAQASPAELLPLGVRQVLVVGETDPVMPARARGSYEAKAKKAGDIVEVVLVPGSHFEVIAPTTEAFPILRDLVLTTVSSSAD